MVPVTIPQWVIGEYQPNFIGVDNTVCIIYSEVQVLTC